MRSRKAIRATTDPMAPGPLAWPFKVLQDLFRNPPFVSEPNFSPFDLDALRSKGTPRSPRNPNSPWVNGVRAQLPFLVWLIVLATATFLGLVLL